MAEEEKNTSKDTEGSKTDRRKAELEKKQKKTMLMMITAIAVVAILAAAFFLMPEEGPEIPPPTADGDYTETANAIVVDSSDISSDAKFYSFDTGTKTIRFFVVEGGDGDIHVAADACDVCYHAAQGYVQDGEEMKCINCGLVFPINNIGVDNTGGGCWPSYIPWTNDNGDIVIEKTALEDKEYMF